MNRDRLIQGLFSIVIIIWAIFIFSKVYDLSDIDYFFMAAKNLVLAGSVSTQSQIVAGHLWNIINLFCLLSGSFVIGTFMLSSWRIKSSSFLEKFVLGIGLGLGAWSYFTFLLGMLGLLNVVLFKGLFWTVFVLSIWYLVKNRKNYQLRFHTVQWPRSYLSLVCLTLMVIVLLINIICALAPEIHFDALVYQLALPDFYMMHGRIVDVPFKFFSYFPQNMNMLYLLTLLVGNSNVAKLLHLFLGLGSLLAIYVFSRKYFSRGVSIAAAAGFYLVPQVAMQSWSALNELGITFYALLSLVCLDNWLEDKDRSGKYLYLTAVYSGFALGIKYMSAPIVVISLCFILYRYGYHERRWKKSFYEIGKFIVIVLLMISPWLVRNFSLTGSPFTPFAATAHKNALGCDFKKDVFLDDCAYPRSFDVKELLVTPWLNTLGKSTFDNLAGPLFIFFIPLFIMVLIRTKIDRKLGLLLFYFMAYYIMWRSQTSIWRYFLPALAVFCIIAGYLIYDTRINAFNRNVLKMIFMGILVGNVAVICMAFEGMDPARIVNGTETKESYLGRSHLFYQDPVYPAIAYINKNVSLTSRILFVGESRGYYCERDYIANSAFDVPTFQKYVKAAKNAAELAQHLRRERLTHILINEKELSRLQKQYNIFDYQSRDIKLLQDFWPRHGRILFHKNGVVLYEII